MLLPKRHHAIPCTAQRVQAMSISTGWPSSDTRKKVRDLEAGPVAASRSVAATKRLAERHAPCSEARVVVSKSRAPARELWVEGGAQSTQNPANSGLQGSAKTKPNFTLIEA